MKAAAQQAVDWHRVEALFPDLLALPRAQRPAFLDQHCRHEAALRAELESLAAAADGPSTLDRGPTLSARGDEAAAPMPELQPGTRIGAWRIERLLGRGGMGEVYLAARAEGGFEQQAAIKLMRADAAQHLERFEAERRILAQLDHPNIAHLLDGGVTDSGRPYMAMEVVVGENLRDYCSRRGLGLAARLALVEQVGRAVAYAHAHLVIHRDLKPANILVTQDGQAKLLDFGVAKLVDPLAGGVTLTTPLTPDHAAPEQLQGRPVTTAVDIYALGVVLFELLAGERPWSFGSTPLSTAVQKLLVEEARRMSRAAADAALPPPVAPRLLQGDLDAIVARCLRKTPQHRYATVEALLADLQRYRRREPVAARGGAWSYVAGRWLRRHRAGVAAGSLVAVALVAGLGVALWQARRAETEAQRAGRVKDFLISVFREADPSRTLGEKVTARRILEQGAARIRQELAAEPLVQADLYEAVADIERGLGARDRALQHAEAALQLRRDALGGDAPATRAAIVTLARVRHDRGDLADAAALLEPLHRQLLRRGDPVLLARVEVQLAGTYLQLFRDDEAWALQRSAYQRLSARGALDQAQMLELRSGFAALLSATGNFTAAEAEFGKLLAAYEQRYGALHPTTIATRIELGDVLSSLGRSEEAAAQLQQAVDASRAVLDADHLLLGDALIKLGYELRGLRRYAEADAALLEAIALYAPQNHFNGGSALRYLGLSLREQNRLDEAERRFTESADLYTRHFGEDSPYRMLALGNLAECRMLRGDYRGAEPLLRDVVARMSKSLPPDSVELRVPRKRLGETLRELGRIDEALQLHRLGLEIERGQFPGGSHLSIAASRHQLALDLLATRRPEHLAEADEHIEAAVAFLEKTDPATPRMLDFLLARAEIALARRDRARAGADLERVAAMVIQPGRERQNALWQRLRRQAAS